MVLEIDPKHSRPFDVHRWSDYPGISKRVNALWEDLGLEVEVEQNKPGFFSAVKRTFAASAAVYVGDGQSCQ